MNKILFKLSPAVKTNMGLIIGNMYQPQNRRYIFHNQDRQSLQNTSIGHTAHYNSDPWTMSFYMSRNNGYYYL